MFRSRARCLSPLGEKETRPRTKPRSSPRASDGGCFSSANGVSPLRRRASARGSWARAAARRRHHLRRRARGVSRRPRAAAATAPAELDDGDAAAARALAAPRRGRRRRALGVAAARAAREPAQTAAARGARRVRAAFLRLPQLTATAASPPPAARARTRPRPRRSTAAAGGGSRCAPRGPARSLPLRGSLSLSRLGDAAQAAPLSYPLLRVPAARCGRAPRRARRARAAARAARRARRGRSARVGLLPLALSSRAFGDGSGVPSRPTPPLGARRARECVPAGRPAGCARRSRARRARARARARARGRAARRAPRAARMKLRPPSAASALLPFFFFRSRALLARKRWALTFEPRCVARAALGGPLSRALATLRDGACDEAAQAAFAALIDERRPVPEPEPELVLRVSRRVLSASRYGDAPPPPLLPSDECELAGAPRRAQQVPRPRAARGAFRMRRRAFYR